jgi:hypothetical protein
VSDPREFAHELLTDAEGWGDVDIALPADEIRSVANELLKALAERDRLREALEQARDLCARRPFCGALEEEKS